MHTTLKSSIIVMLAISLLSLSGCANWSKTAKGGVIGGSAGGAIGGLIGKKAGNTTAGILIGTAIGGAAGAAIGRYMDKQAAELEQIEGATVERVGEGIKVTFDSGILFDVNQSALQQEARDNIQKMAEVMKKYGETEIVIQGHTDSSGSDELNQRLSEQRAQSVADYIVSKGINASRIFTEGFGEREPIADNSTVEGRKQNRRVELAIFANDKLKESAQKGELN
jgi:outer membrane protein OmpA-like peptidoglycan-associated protein